MHRLCTAIGIAWQHAHSRGARKLGHGAGDDAGQPLRPIWLNRQNDPGVGT